jgi:alkylation response protein AidB-like acyl-CoA dehydrogenase
MDQSAGSYFTYPREGNANGRITNAPLSSTFLIYAKTGTEGPASKGLTAFIVERSSKGFEVGEHLDKFGVSLLPENGKVLIADARISYCRAVLR